MAQMTYFIQFLPSGGRHIIAPEIVSALIQLEISRHIKRGEVCKARLPQQRHQLAAMVGRMVDGMYGRLPERHFAGMVVPWVFEADWP